jgi:hypothetical protein
MNLKNSRLLAIACIVAFLSTSIHSHKSKVIPTTTLDNDKSSKKIVEQFVWEKINPVQPIIYREVPTDQEIRDLRRANPELIIKVNGRVIPNERQLINNYIESYLEDNIDHYIDKYKD